MQVRLSGEPAATSQEQRKQILRHIEEYMGAYIEEELAKRSDTLADVSSAQVSTDILKFEAIRKFLLRHKQINNLEAVVKEYIETQVYLTQSVSLERDLLTLSQYVRQHVGIAQAVSLLENIQKPDFELAGFMQAHVAANAAAFPQQILDTMQRITRFYHQAEIKRSFYADPAAKEEASYKKLQEAVMWLDGQRLLCITGMNKVMDKSVAKVAVAVQDGNGTANRYSGARSHIQAAIGLFVDEELVNMADRLALIPVEDMVSLIKTKPSYQQLISALGDRTRAGFNTYLPDTATVELIGLIEEYLHASMHLAQSVMHERNLIKISQYVRQHNGIDAAKKLLIDIEKPDFDCTSFFRRLTAPNQEISALIENIHKFYLYAEVKKHDRFFDAEDAQAKKLCESEMWLGLQRRCCIQGMSLIAAGEVYQGKQIDFANLNLPLETAVQKRESVSVRDNVKKPRNDDVQSTPAVVEPMFASLPASHSDLASMQGGMSEEEALEQAIMLSSMQIDPREVNGVNNEEAAFAEALRLSRGSNRESVQQIPAVYSAQASGVAAPMTLFAASSLSSGNVRDCSLLDDAKKILDMLKELAKEAANEPEAEMPYIGDGDEQARLYSLTHFTSLDWRAAGLTKERFDAAADLVTESAGWQRDVYKNELDIQIYKFGESITVSAKHSFAMQHKYRYEFGRNLSYEESLKNVPAPIYKVPFDRISQGMDEFVRNNFANWNTNHYEPGTLIKRCANNGEKYNVRGSLYHIEACCKHLDPGFDLGMNNENMYRNDDAFSVSVNKVKFEKAQALILGEQGYVPEIRRMKASK